MSLMFDLAALRPLYMPQPPSLLATTEVTTDVHQFVSWPEIRAALVAAQSIKTDKIQVSRDLNYYVERNPNYLELTSRDAQRFNQLISEFVESTRAPIETLLDIFPTPPDAHWIAVSCQDIQPTNLRALADHAEAVMNTAIDEAAEVYAVSGGSSSLLLTAGKATMLGLQTAYSIAEAVGSEVFLPLVEVVKHAMEVVQPAREYPDITDAALRLTAMQFLDANKKEILEALGGSETRYNEADDKIVLASRLMHEAKGQFSWSIPPGAVIFTLPHGVEALTTNPELTTAIVRELMSHPQE